MKLATPPDVLSPALTTPAPKSASLERHLNDGGTMTLMRIRERAARFWLRTLFRIAPKIPGTLRTAGPILCRMTFRASRHIRTVTTLNARRILGDHASPQDVNRVARGVLANFYSFCCDVAASSNATLAQLLARVDTIEGREHYVAARAAGNGAIIVTAHMGSFEVGLAALRQIEETIHVVFRRDPDPEFEGSRSRLRERLGVKEAPVDEGWTVWMRLRDALLRNEAVVLQGDRVMPGQKGQAVPFLSGHLMLPTGPIKLAAATGAPIIPVFAIRNQSGTLRVFIEPAIETSNDASVPDPLVRWAHVLEQYVRKYPEQWLLLQPALIEDVPAPYRSGET